MPKGSDELRELHLATLEFINHELRLETFIENLESFLHPNIYSYIHQILENYDFFQTWGKSSQIKNITGSFNLQMPPEGIFKLETSFMVTSKCVNGIHYGYGYAVTLSNLQVKDMWNTEVSIKLRTNPTMVPISIFKLFIESCPKSIKGSVTNDLEHASLDWEFMGSLTSWNEFKAEIRNTQVDLSASVESRRSKKGYTAYGKVLAKLNLGALNIPGQVRSVSTIWTSTPGFLDANLYIGEQHKYRLSNLQFCPE